MQQGMSEGTRRTYILVSIKKKRDIDPWFLQFLTKKAAHKLCILVIFMGHYRSSTASPTSPMTSDTMVSDHYFLVLALLTLSAPLAVVAGDPDILTDYVFPTNANPANITGDFFTYSGFRAAMNTSTPPLGFTATKATMMEFPALNGQSVSYAMLTFPSGSVNPTHAHPRSAELLLVVGGALSVGFVDTANKLYTQDLTSGDMFVFPKGTVHYQFNQGTQPALALSAFGSAAAGLVSVPAAVFEDGIDDAVLAKSFKTDEATIQKLKAGLAFRCC